MYIFHIHILKAVRLYANLVVIEFFLKIHLKQQKCPCPLLGLFAAARSSWFHKGITDDNLDLFAELC